MATGIWDNAAGVRWLDLRGYPSAFIHYHFQEGRDFNLIILSFSNKPFAYRFF